MLQRRTFVLVSTAVLGGWAAVWAAAWPSAAAQVARMDAPRGSALERFILAHQNLSALRPDEAADRLPIPPWLRAGWRQAHPEGNYSAADPTGGYPFVLKEVAHWMRKHPSLAPGPREADRAEPPLRASAGANVRISGPAGGPRSESDIRINFRNPQQVVAAS